MFLEKSEERLYTAVLKEFGKTKADVDDYIRIIREWCDSQPHFPEKPSDKLLQSLLLYHKLSTENTKQAIDMYYTSRTLIPELFEYSPLSEVMQRQHRIWHMVILPKTDHQYRRFVYYRFNSEYSDPILFDHTKQLNHALNLLELLTLEDNSFRLHIVWDLLYFKMGHIPKLNLMTLKKCIIIFEKVFSTNLSSIYLVNFPSFFETVMNTMLKPLLKPKMREKVITSSSTDILLKDFGEDLMPEDIGGRLTSIEKMSDEMDNLFKKYRDRFEKLASLTVNESLRPYKLDNDEILGYYGSFRKIDVD